MDYNNIKFIDQLLRRIESLERKVGDLQDRNLKLEKMMRDSFISFKFTKPVEINHRQQDSMDRLRELFR